MTTHKLSNKWSKVHGGLFVAFTSILVSCGGGGSSSNSSSVTPPPPPVNSAPTVVNVTVEAMDGIALGITLSGSDSDGTVASCTPQSQNLDGNLTGDFPSYSYSNNGFLGTTSFTYTCTDDDGAESNVGTVTINVSASTSGFFIDSAVRGLRYVSGEVTGVTDEAGEFRVGDSNVQFFVGDIFIGETSAGTFVTPISLSATLSSQDAAGNIAQFLQSLDEDLDADNGIFISDQTISAFTGSGLEINFDVDKTQFQSAGDISAALSSLPSAIVLLPRNDTDQHLKESIAVLRTDPITENLIASTYFGGRNLEVYENSVLSSPETNEYNYISGTVDLIENNPSDLPIAGSESLTNGEDDFDRDKFIVAMNPNLTEVVGSLISRPLSLETVYSEGVVLRADEYDPSRGILSGIQVFSKDLSDEIVNLEEVCSPFDNVSSSEFNPNRAYLINAFPDGSSLSAICMVEIDGTNFGVNYNGIETLAIRTFDSDFQETKKLEVELPDIVNLDIIIVNHVQTDVDGNIYFVMTALPEGATGDERDLLVGDTTIILSKHSSDGVLLSSTVFGSADLRAREEIEGLLISPDGSVIIAGTLFFGDSSQDNSEVDAGFPTASEGAIKPNFDNLRDGFVAIYDTDLRSLERFTFVGGDNFVDGISTVAVDSGSNIHVAGLTLSNDIPVTENAIQTTVGSNDSFYMKISSTLDEILYSTYFGNFQTRIRDLSVAADGSVFVSGPTTDPDLPVTDGESFDKVLEESFDPDLFNSDLFISRIWPNQLPQ